MLCINIFCSMTQGWQLKEESKIRKQCHVCKNSSFWTFLWSSTTFLLWKSEGVSKPLTHQQEILAASLTSVRSTAAGVTRWTRTQLNQSQRRAMRKQKQNSWLLLLITLWFSWFIFQIRKPKWHCQYTLQKRQADNIKPSQRVTGTKEELQLPMLSFLLALSLLPKLTYLKVSTNPVTLSCPLRLDKACSTRDISKPLQLGCDTCKISGSLAVHMQLAQCTCSTGLCTDAAGSTQYYSP